MAEAASGSIEHGVATALAFPERLQELGLARAAGSGGRFRQNPAWQADERAVELIEQARADIQTRLDDAVLGLFEGLP